MAVNRNAPFGDVIESKQQSANRRFAGAAGADQRDSAASRDLKGNVFQDCPSGIVGKGNIVKA